MSVFIEDSGWQPCTFGSRRTVIVRGPAKLAVFDAFATTGDLPDYGVVSKVRCMTSAQTGYTSSPGCETLHHTELGARRRCTNVIVYLATVALRGDGMALSDSSVRRCLKRGGGELR